MLELLLRDHRAVGKRPTAILHLVLEELLEGQDDHLGLHTWAELVALGRDVVLENLCGHVAQVFVAERTEQFQRTLLLIGVAIEEVE